MLEGDLRSVSIYAANFVHSIGSCSKFVFLYKKSSHPGFLTSFLPR